MSDYISREALLDRYDAEHVGPPGRARELIVSAPAIDVAPVRRGRWIEGDGIQICSECGEEHEWEDYRAPYCDTFGARMNKEEANERMD